MIEFDYNYLNYLLYFCITNSTKIDSLIKIINNFQFKESGYLKEIKILEEDKILKRKIKKQIKRR